MPSTDTLFVTPSTEAAIDSAPTLNEGPKASWVMVICFSTPYSLFTTLTVAVREDVEEFFSTETLRVDAPFSPFAGVSVTQSDSHVATHEILPSTDTLFVTPSTEAAIDSVPTLNEGPKASWVMVICLVIFLSSLTNSITAVRCSIERFSSIVISTD